MLRSITELTITEYLSSTSKRGCIIGPTWAINHRLISQRHVIYESCTKKLPSSAKRNRGNPSPLGRPFLRLQLQPSVLMLLSFITQNMVTCNSNCERMNRSRVRRYSVYRHYLFRHVYTIFTCMYKCIMRHLLLNKTTLIYTYVLYDVLCIMYI